MQQLHKNKKGPFLDRSMRILLVLMILHKIQVMGGKSKAERAEEMAVGWHDRKSNKHKAYVKKMPRSALSAILQPR